MTFGIIFSRPLWHLTSWWITLSIGFVNSHRADWWEIQQKMSQNISAIYKKNLQNNYHGITFKLKKDWLGKTLSSRGKWAKTLSKGIFFGQTIFFLNFFWKESFWWNYVFFPKLFFWKESFWSNYVGHLADLCQLDFWLNFLKRSDKSNTSKILEKCRDILKSKLKLPTNTFLVKNQMAQIADNI